MENSLARALFAIIFFYFLSAFVAFDFATPNEFAIAIFDLLSRFCYVST